MSSTRLSLATALVVALIGTPRGVCFVGVGSAARTGREASAPRHAAVARATERRRGAIRAMQTDAEEEIRAASLANVRQRVVSHMAHCHITTTRPRMCAISVHVSTGSGLRNMHAPSGHADAGCRLSGLWVSVSAPGVVCVELTNEAHGDVNMNTGPREKIIKNVALYKESRRTSQNLDRPVQIQM